MHNMHDSARKQAEAIWRAGVRAVQPANCVPAALRPLAALTQGWQANKPYRVIGGGKAGAAMAQATESFLLSQGIPGENLEGWVNIPEGSAVAALQRIHLHPSRPAGYNFPTPAAVAGTEAMLKLIENAPWDAVILCLISGGGSAILSAPTVPLEDKLTISRMLTAAGANIRELNTVRKHLSRFKGGQLAQHCLAPAPGRQLISLIISDVLGDPLDVIASGPTAPDPTTFADARQILQAKKLWDRAPASVRDYLEAGLSGKHPETPKQAVAEEPRLVHRLAASIQQAVHAAANEAEALGYQVIEYVDQRDHDTLTLASYFADQVLSLEQERPVCLVSGGETTVQLPADAGRGGRNQSFALGFLLHLDALLQPADAPNDPSSNDLSWNRRSAWRGITGLFAGTDGEDGPTDAAGAFADAAVLERARELGLHPAAALARHDAYPFFDATGALFRTGLTDTNVMDLRVILLP